MTDRERAIKYRKEARRYKRKYFELKRATEQTGHWIRVTDKAGHLVWECDKCCWQQRYNTNFCPDCGARMVEPQESEVSGMTYGNGELPNGGWISVSERLPEDSGEYLVSVIDEYDGNYEAVGVAWFAHKKDYEIKESEWRDLGIDETVIAWMPAPEPYKEDNDGETI